MSDRLGYVVIEYNQASRIPGLNPYGDLYDEIDGAREERRDLEQTARESGRRETYRIAEVTLIEDGEDV